MSMNKIYLIGDMHTVSAFRLAGVAGVVSDKTGVADCLEDVIAKGDAGIVAITSELAREIQEKITAMALSGALPVIVEIPGIDDAEGFGMSALGYVSEALGIAL